MAEFLSPTPRREGEPFLFVVAFIAALGGFCSATTPASSRGRRCSSTATYTRRSSSSRRSLARSCLVRSRARAICLGYLADAISRRWTKVISGTIYALAALGCAFSQSADQLIVAASRSFIRHVESERRSNSDCRLGVEGGGGAGGCVHEQPGVQVPRPGRLRRRARLRAMFVVEIEQYVLANGGTV